MRIRAAYNAIPTDKNPYLKKGWKPNKTTVRVGILYMLALIGDPGRALVYARTIRCCSRSCPPALYVAIMAFYALIPDAMYHQSRVHPVISMRAMTLMRITYISLLFNGLAWLSLYVTPYAALFYLLLWVVPIFTSFSFFMILRQLVQHGNGDRGWLTNTRVFFVNPLINFAVFPMGQDYHLPHHLFASVPHYRLKELHELLCNARSIASRRSRSRATSCRTRSRRRSRPCWTCSGPTIIIAPPTCTSTTRCSRRKRSRRRTRSCEQGEEEKRKRREEAKLG